MWRVIFVSSCGIPLFRVNARVGRLWCVPRRHGWRCSEARVATHLGPPRLAPSQVHLAAWRRGCGGAPLLKPRLQDAENDRRAWQWGESRFIRVATAQWRPKRRRHRHSRRRSKRHRAAARLFLALSLFLSPFVGVEPLRRVCSPRGVLPAAAALGRRRGAKKRRARSRAKAVGGLARGQAWPAGRRAHRERRRGAAVALRECVVLQSRGYVVGRGRRGTPDIGRKSAPQPPARAPRHQRATRRRRRTQSPAGARPSAQSIHGFVCPFAWGSGVEVRPIALQGCSGAEFRGCGGRRVRVSGAACLRG